MSNQFEPSADHCGPPLVCEPLSSESAVALAQMFKAIADPVRLQLLSRVAAHDGGEACVCDISGAVDVSQPTVSHHLKVLREAGLLESERRGTWVYYRVVPPALQTLSTFLVSVDTMPTMTAAVSG